MKQPLVDLHDQQAALGVFMIGSRIISGLLFTTLALFGYTLDSSAAKSPHISKNYSNQPCRPQQIGPLSCRTHL